jgi:hypothetical protein
MGGKDDETGGKGSTEGWDPHLTRWTWGSIQILAEPRRLTLYSRHIGALVMR